MLALMLRRHLPFILSASAAALFLALAAVVVVIGPQDRNARALGDPNAPPPAAAEPAPVGRPPVARPAALPPDALASGDGAGGAPRNLVEARMPDDRFHPAAIAAVQCVIGREVPHDPALDAVAVAIWRARASAETIDAALAEEARIARDANVRMSAVLSGLAASHAAGDDPCRFAEVDLRAQLTHPAWRDARAIGVAFFPEPDATAPVSTLVAVAR